MGINTSRRARSFGLGGFLAAAALMLAILTPEQKSVSHPDVNRAQQANFNVEGQKPAGQVVAYQQLGDQPGRAQQAFW